MKRAFSLVELMIVLAILGILAAIVLPHFRSQASQAKEAVAKDNLRMLRGAIELYTAQHKGVPPGYQEDDVGSEPDSTYFYQQTVLSGNYFRKIPENPFNNLNTMSMIGNSQSFPAAATGGYGWIYQPATMTIKLDWPGTDENGLLYYDY
jgi:type II secretion system protein G